MIEAAGSVKKILVLGSHGMLGAALAAYFGQRGHEIKALGRDHFDPLVHSPSQLEVRGFDAVINAIGIINRHLSQLDESVFWRVNGLHPRQLADHCLHHGIPLIHISTDCVFSGHGAPHDEARAPDAADLYGRSKASGEPVQALVIRTSIIGPELRHHYSLLSWLAAQGDPVPGFTDHAWNGVTTFELARCLEQLLASGAHRKAGLHHLHGEDLSKYELLSLANEVFGMRKTIVPTRSSSPRDTRLATRYPEWLAALRVRPMRRQLEDLRSWCGADFRLRGSA